MIICVFSTFQREKMFGLLDERIGGGDFMGKGLVLDWGKE